MIVRFFVVSILSMSLAYGSCVRFNRVHGVVDIKKKTWKTLHVNKDSTQVCGPLPIPVSPNLEITVSKGKNIFSTKIFQGLEEYWDKFDGKKLTGGSRPVTNLSIQTFVPTWFKGAKLKIKEIETNKVLIEATL